MSLTLWIGNLLVPVAVVAVDFGRRRLTLLRLLRPFVLTAVIVPFVLPGFDLRGTGLALELAGVAVGVLLGFGTASLMRLERDPVTGQAWTVAGLAYVAAWAVFAAARLLFVYESGHSVSFGHALGTFLLSNHISVTALADSVLFTGLAMMVANRAVLLVRSRRAAASGRALSPA